MEVNAIFVDDYSSLLNAQMRGFAEVLRRAKQRIQDRGENRVLSLTCEGDILEQLIIGQEQDIINFKLKHIRIENSNEYNLAKINLQNYINELNAEPLLNEQVRKNVVILDLCLDGSISAPPRDYLDDISEMCDSLIIITSWPNFYENNITNDGKYYKGLHNDVFFVKRALDRQGRDLNWFATDNNPFYYEDELNGLHNEDLKWLINEFKDSDSICLKYWAAILLSVGLACQNDIAN